METSRGLYYLTCPLPHDPDVISILFLFLNLFILAVVWVFVAVRGLSLVAVSRGYSLLRCAGFSLRQLLVAERGLQARRLLQLWLAGSRAQGQQFWCMGLVAPRYVGSSRSRARTRVPCVGRRILNHCTTREVLSIQFLREVVTDLIVFSVFINIWTCSQGFS